MIGIFALLASGFAADPSGTQEIHELEWSRELPVTLATKAPGGSAQQRADVARALGRLRSPDALEFLEGMVSDEDEGVRIAVAAALGWTPGSAEQLRTWLQEVPEPKGLAARAAADGGLRVQLLEGLGRQGTARDVALLTEATAEAWPTGAAAARALGRLGKRQIAGIDAARTALVDALERPDPRLVESAAYGLRRVGLGTDAALTGKAAARARSAPTAAARAWLVAAAWPALDDEARTDLFVAAVTDPSRLVRVAALVAVQEGQIPVDLVGAYIVDGDPWLASAAAEALGRLGTPEAIALLEERANGDDPWAAAAAVQAAPIRDAAAASDDDVPLPVRAALVAAIEDAELLVAFATGEDPAPLRSAAAGALLQRESAGYNEGTALLEASDPVVREAAMELVGKGADGPVAKLLLPHLRVEPDLEVLTAAAAVLSDIADRDPRKVRADDPSLSHALKRLARSDTARHRTTAEALASAVGAELPPRQGAEDGEADGGDESKRELVLPDGSVEEVSAGAPAVAVARRARGARVQTSAGSFVIALDPDTAPLAVANFTKLAEAEFFDDLVFHRVVPGFVVQTGCPRGDGWGGPGWTVPDEISAVPFAEGSVGMARSGPDTGGSQWFVTTSPQPHLDGDYTRFGSVVQGMHVVRSLRVGDVVESVVIEHVDVPPS